MRSEDFFFRLKIRREKLGLSQKDLAERIGVSTNTIQSWERDTFPKGDALILLSEQLKCSIDWLLTGRSGGQISDHENPEKEDLDYEQGNMIVLQHIDLIKKFKDRESAKSANNELLNIERMNEMAFREVVSYIKGIANGLKLATQSHMSKGVEEPDDPVNPQRSGERRAGVDRRKMG